MSSRNLVIPCLPLLLFAVMPQKSIAQDATSSNTLTHGMVQMTLKVGVTTQAEIIEAFGGPNITTFDSNGDEMWVYDRHATVSSDQSGGFAIGLGLGGGSSVGAAGGIGFGKKKSQSQTTTKSMTLIIKFDKQRVVSDFKSRSSSF